MGKWFSQAREIERLRHEKQLLLHENQRLLALVAQLKEHVGEEAADVDTFAVSAEERLMAASGRKIAAIKAYRERTGADLVTAKNAIDSVS
ncbi:50S ribosomal protein L7/L12 [Arcanobacterium pinnipediorum]|uniref:50S ribosomal protein L7/L12 n=1 Tax=Arcanobacterium pinnipediorum TaxID=1503041 RepID=A0ABY5AGP8_9ACTO|nr:50S ribosomal protein L7/L12 [Arcanobacterium pinnipediorum]USR79383.1 50S ribosomal protein L7/L12 [Arcanobacterium pinnipediorum]